MIFYRGTRHKTAHRKSVSRLLAGVRDFPAWILLGNFENLSGRRNSAPGSLFLGRNRLRRFWFCTVVCDGLWKPLERLGSAWWCNIQLTEVYETMWYARYMLLTVCDLVGMIWGGSWCWWGKGRSVCRRSPLFVWYWITWRIKWCYFCDDEEDR